LRDAKIRNSIGLQLINVPVTKLTLQFREIAQKNLPRNRGRPRRRRKTGKRGNNVFVLGK